MRTRHGPICANERIRLVTAIHTGALFAALVVQLFCPFNLILAQTNPEASPDIARLAQQAEADLHNQKPAMAAAEYKKILALDPNNVSAHSNLGLAFYMQDQFAQAAGEFKIALSHKPDLWNIAALCGLSEAKSGENADALEHLQPAFQHVAEPSLRMAVGKQLFGLLFEGGDLKSAADVVDQLQKLDSENVDVLYAAHQVYSLLADKAFLAMAHLGPTSARMYQLRGDRMAQIGNKEGAITAYRLAIVRDPHLSGAHFALGEVLSVSPNAKQREEAEGEYYKALEDNPLDEKAECRLGDIEVQRSNLQAASTHYKRALQLQPNDPDVNEGMGLVLLASNRTQEALVYLNRAVQIDPMDMAAHYHLSLANRKTGDLNAAKHEMDEFLKLKAVKDKLRSSFDDLPLQVVRQTSRGQNDQYPEKAAPQ
jgi:tetratricopeptide (TPR) repeat protein